MKQEMKRRGIYEEVRGPGEWWIGFADVIGRIRCEGISAENATPTERNNENGNV